MARVTIEDCVKHVNNRFKLVLLATRRARNLASGSEEALVPWNNNKAAVVALREVAQGYKFENSSLADNANELVVAELQQQLAAVDDPFANTSI